MANRTETAHRKAAMQQELRTAHAAGTAQGGNLPLSQRELCLRFALSGQTVSKVLQELVQEGVLYTVPRVGTFLGRPRQMSAEPFLLIRRPLTAGGFEVSIQSGFETRIAQLGGSTLGLTPEEALWHKERAGLPPLSGVFELGTEGSIAAFAADGLPCGSFEAPMGLAPKLDIVNFDNSEGGRQATQHLLNKGHRNIAFLALHNPQDQMNRFRWSAEREVGWRQLLRESGQDPDLLAFHPAATSELDSDFQADLSQHTALPLINNPNITAVVAVNSFAARGLLVGLRQSGLPTNRWPAIVCFDLPATTDSVVSCLQLPWEKIGRTAAQVLWERRTGRLSGPPVTRLVPMQMIPRLTCRSDWAALSLAHSRAMDTLSQPVPQTAGRLRPATV